MNRIVREKRRKRIRARLRGTAERPRVSVFRSNQNLEVQLIDDESGVTMLGISSIKEKSDEKVKQASVLGEKVAALARKKGVKKLVFDRAGYRYQGRVKALADAMRKGGLDF